MAGVIALNDASRRPTRFPFVTATIIVLNVAVFLLEAISATFTVSRLLKNATHQAQLFEPGERG
jgi:hypothetical protein